VTNSASSGREDGAAVPGVNVQIAFSTPHISALDSWPG